MITLVLYYIIEYREFPDRWTEGHGTPVFKNGRVDDTDNYRGITVLSVFAQVFETAVNNRIAYASEAFREDGETNGGFLKRSRIADNIFIVLCLVQRQLFGGKPLFICMVDFSKAFDLVNGHILFYKLMKQGYLGNVINTLRNLYWKTYFKVKCNGMLSPPILDQLGVNQGGNASLPLFRTYLTRGKAFPRKSGRRGLPYYFVFFCPDAINLSFLVRSFLRITGLHVRLESV